jgi:hypothetical protein
MTFILTVLANLLSSFIFIFLLLFLLRPKIKISPNICCKNDSFDNTEHNVYLIKVINTSLFSGYDINVELSSLVSYPVRDGRNFRYTRIPMKVEKLDFIARYKFGWKKKNYGDFACLFRCYEDLDKILKEDSNSIKFQVTLRHGVTGLSRVFNTEYALSSDIKHGHFSFGNNFNIV